MTKLPLLMHHYGARRGVGCVSGPGGGYVPRLAFGTDDDSHGDS